jgi:hypothetical protein
MTKVALCEKGVQLGIVIIDLFVSEECEKRVLRNAVC